MPDVTPEMIAMGVAFLERELDDYLPPKWSLAESFVVGLYRAMRVGAETRAVALTRRTKRWLSAGAGSK